MAPANDPLGRLHPGIQTWVQEQSWPDLTAVQKAAMPVILAGRHCLVEAPTAGGKTEAVLFPALTRVAETQGPGVRILYLAPLRALLNDLEIRARVYASACGLHAFKWHGDVSQRSKLDSFHLPPEVLLTTPESVEAILLRKAGWERFFQGLQIIVIDEAHNFAFGERGHHLLALLERLEHRIGHRSQRIAITATIGNPVAMARWLVPNGTEPAERISVSGAAPRRDFSLRLFDEAGDSPDGDTGPSATVRRFAFLAKELRGRRLIVFVRSRAGAEDLAKAFLRAGRGPSALRVRTHHSAVSRYFREEAEALIKTKSETGLDAILAPRPSSWASTSGPWIWSSSSMPCRVQRPFCSGSAGPAGVPVCLNASGGYVRRGGLAPAGRNGQPRPRGEVGGAPIPVQGVPHPGAPDHLPRTAGERCLPGRGLARPQGRAPSLGSARPNTKA